jgi:hypothetical protein
MYMVFGVMSRGICKLGTRVRVGLTSSMRHGLCVTLRFQSALRWNTACLQITATFSVQVCDVDRGVNVDG